MEKYFTILTEKTFHNVNRKNISQYYWKKYFTILSIKIFQNINRNNISQYYQKNISKY
jgi:hypothetical protein